MKTLGKWWSDWLAEVRAEEARKQAARNAVREERDAKLAAMSEGERQRFLEREARTSRALVSVLGWIVVLAIFGYVALHLDEITPRNVLVVIVFFGLYAVMKAIERNKGRR